MNLNFWIIIERVSSKAAIDRAEEFKYCQKIWGDEWQENQAKWRKILLMFILGEGVKKHRKTKRSLKFSHPIDSIRKFEGVGVNLIDI